jgi:CDP-paratose synthetase
MKGNVLLTGATGFLGSNLLKPLIEEGYHVVVLKRSFSDTSRINVFIDQVRFYDIDKIDLKSVFEENKIDVIIHCATSYGRKNEEPINLIESNLIFPLQLLALGKKASVPCFINTDTILDKRVNHYSLSKKHFEDWFGVYENDMLCINVVLEHFYGPDDDETKFVSHIIQKLLIGTNCIDLTEGLQERDFIYIDDVVGAFLLILKSIPQFEKGSQRFEIGTNKPIKIREFVNLVKKISGNDNTILNFGAIPYRVNEIMKFEVNTTSIRKLGWQPKILLEEGLSRTIMMEKTR